MKLSSNGGVVKNGLQLLHVHMLLVAHCEPATWVLSILVGGMIITISEQPTVAFFSHLSAVFILIILPVGLLCFFSFSILYANISLSILATSLTLDLGTTENSLSRSEPHKDETPTDTVCPLERAAKVACLHPAADRTGIRRGECSGIKWETLNFRDNTITIAGNLCYTPQQGVYLDTPKNGKSRTVDVDPEIMALLRSLREEQAQQSNICFIFTQDNTFASISINSGADIASVSAKLGHAETSTTLDMYTHADQVNNKAPKRNLPQCALW